MAAKKTPPRKTGGETKVTPTQLKRQILKSIDRELSAHGLVFESGTYSRDDGSGGHYTRSD